MKLSLKARNYVKYLYLYQNNLTEHVQNLTTLQNRKKCSEYSAQK